MDEQSDPDFLKSEEYKSSKDLDIRMDIQEQFSLRQENWFTWLYERINIPEGKINLELGSGPGDLWSDNAGKIKPGLQMLLSDLSEGMIIEARRRIKNISAFFDFCVLDVQSIPLPENTCQAVIANGLLDHTPDRVQSLSEIHRVLSPNGKLLTSTGSQRHLKEMEDLVHPYLEKADFGGAPERFGLENGEKILSPWFVNIRLERYEDELLFTDPHPVAAYILSEAAVRKNLSEEQKKEFLRYLQTEIDRRGELRVRVEKGLFTAERR
jgi:ubiquinone/menaquinone biosynthesis C-methylase UbiE